MTYSQYAYVEAFLDMKQKSWITAHVHMYEYFGGVAKILVPDNYVATIGNVAEEAINKYITEQSEESKKEDSEGAAF